MVRRESPICAQRKRIGSSGKEHSIRVLKKKLSLTLQTTQMHWNKDFFLFFSLRCLCVCVSVFSWFLFYFFILLFVFCFPRTRKLGGNWYWKSKRSSQLRFCSKQSLVECLPHFDQQLSPFKRAQNVASRQFSFLFGLALIRFTLLPTALLLLVTVMLLVMILLFMWSCAFACWHIFACWLLISCHFCFCASALVPLRCTKKKDKTEEAMRKRGGVRHT